MAKKKQRCEADSRGFSFAGFFQDLHPAQLAEGTATEGVAGVHFAGRSDQGRVADTSLATLPSPYLSGTLRLTTAIRWETQRGCPFSCTFCQHREPGRLRRGRFQVSRLHDELSLFACADVERISVLDPIFNAKRARAIALLQEARRQEVKATLSLQCRFEMMDRDTLQAMQGLQTSLEFGLQTTDPRIARTIGRPNNLERVEAAIHLLHAHGHDVEVSLIYGLPTQTPAHLAASITWLRDRGIRRIAAYPLMLLRGTKLERERERWGFIDSDERIPIVIQSNHFTRTEHAEMSQMASELEAQLV